MKNLLLFVAAALVVFQTHSNVWGQGQRGGQRSGQGAMRGQGSGGQTPPLFRIFDADQNGELSSDEIDNASKAIRKLDGDQNGTVTLDEFRSGNRPDGRGQGGGRGGARGGQRGGGGGRSGGGQAETRGGPPGGQGGPTGGPGAGRGGNPAQGDTQFAQQVLELDENRDNLISSAELPEHMQAAFKIADADKDGSLNEKELLVLASQFRRNKLNPDGENSEMKNRPTKGAPQGRR